MTQKIFPCTAGGMELPLAEMQRLERYKKSRSARKLSNFEFARIWGEDGTNEALRIDLAGSDRTDTIDLVI